MLPHPLCLSFYFLLRRAVAHPHNAPLKKYAQSKKKVCRSDSKVVIYFAVFGVEITILLLFQVDLTLTKVDLFVLG